MEGGSSEKEQPAGIKRGRKIQKLTAVDIGRQYLDSIITQTYVSTTYLF